MAGWGRCRSCQARIWWGTSPFDSSRAFPFNDQDESESHFQTCAAQEWVTDSEDQRQRVSKCRACGERVWWQTTFRGRRRPMNCDGDVGTDECHFDTCAGEPVGATTTFPEPEYVADIDLWLGELGLKQPVTLADITSAFRALAMRHHPDMGGSTSDFIRIKLAFDRCKELMAAGLAA
jgi:hypothetical protein